MLRNVCCGVVICTISLLLTACLLVVGMTLLLLLLVTIMEFFRSGFREKKLLPFTFSRCVWGAKWKGLLCSIKISLVWFMDLMVSVICFLKFLLNKFRHAFAVVTPFLLTLVLLWYWEFITRPNKFNYSWYAILFLLCPSSNAICST